MSRAVGGALVAAVLLGGIYAAMCALGWADHASILAGMPQSAASPLLGPLFVMVYLATITLVPALLLFVVLTGAWEIAARARGRWRRAC
ncbi:MAG: hypothetical protein JST00_11900 [Deltaproteobacteria bacterium]|nr:hypothetical protein [Deltaproteobacteria bacterium]